MNVYFALQLDRIRLTIIAKQMLLGLKRAKMHTAIVLQVKAAKYYKLLKIFTFIMREQIKVLNEKKVI